jgi:GxxExxY protein
VQSRSIGSWDQDCWSASIGERSVWELEARGVSYEVEHPVRIHYRERVLGVHRLDLLVEGRVIVELKSVQRLEFVHMAQVLSYLRAAELRAGLLLNFFAAPLAIRRIVL